MSKKQILIVAMILGVIVGFLSFLLMTPPGVMFVLLMWILMSEMFPLSPDVSFVMMVTVLFSVAVIVIYLMFRNLRTISPQ
ncbi:MAG: hypothetical protein AAB497_01365 [Patescibacteria group bacterium]